MHLLRLPSSKVNELCICMIKAKKSRHVCCANPLACANNTEVELRCPFNIKSSTPRCFKLVLQRTKRGNIATSAEQGVAKFRLACKEVAAKHLQVAEPTAVCPACVALVVMADVAAYDERLESRLGCFLCFQCACASKQVAYFQAAMAGLSCQLSLCKCA